MTRVLAVRRNNLTSCIISGIFSGIFLAHIIWFFIEGIRSPRTGWGALNRLAFFVVIYYFLPLFIIAISRFIIFTITYVKYPLERIILKDDKIILNVSKKETHIIDIKEIVEVSFSEFSITIKTLTKEHKGYVLESIHNSEYVCKDLDGFVFGINRQPLKTLESDYYVKIDWEKEFKE